MKYIARDMERKVQYLIEESSRFALIKDFAKSLETAKEARKLEREVFNFREIHGLNEQTISDLSYASLLNLAISFQDSEMMEDAIDVYSMLIKQKEHPNAERLRVNIGNIFYHQGKYRDAIKMYRMALDQIPSTERKLGYKVSFNVGKAFLKIGQYREAIQHFEAIMTSSPSHEVGFNLVLCYFTICDIEKIKRGFTKLSSIPITCSVFDTVDDDSLATNLTTKEADIRDILNQLMDVRVKEGNHFIFTAARIIAPVVAMNTWASGYRWAVEQLYRKGNIEVANQLEIEQALEHLRKNEISLAFELLKSFEKKGQSSKAIAAPNLSTVYFLEGDHTSAHSFANLALSHSRFNPLSIVNKGNCLFVEGDYLGAKAMYLEAIAFQSGCIVALFNLGLVNLKLCLVRDARSAFEKIQRLTPGYTPAIYLIASLCEQGSDLKEAIKWLSVLISGGLADAGVLSRIGQIYVNANDERQGFYHLFESYKLYPINLDVLNWLGVWFLKNEMYEQSISMFERGWYIQPNESKWPLMICSCYHRMKNYSESHDLYKKIHEKFPENIECEIFY